MFELCSTLVEDKWKNYSDTVAVVEVGSAAAAVAAEDIDAVAVEDIAAADVGDTAAVVVGDTADAGDTGQVLTS